MHTDITFLEIAFRICIFGLLAYKVYDLIQKYLIPFFGEQITLEQNQRTELIEKEKLLISTRHRIENQIYTQKQMFTLLEKNIQVWHETYVKNNICQENEANIVIKKNEEKRVLQKKNIILAKTLECTLPDAFAQARDALIMRYQKNDDRENIKKIIDNLPSDMDTHTKVI